MNHYGGFILSYNGGQIINAQTGELMFEKRIDPAMIPYLNRKAKENGFAIFTYHKDYILTDSPENKHVQEEAELIRCASSVWRISRKRWISHL